jgi:hypothetical protein
MLINRLKQKLSELGATLDDPVAEVIISFVFNDSMKLIEVEHYIT